jgi:hypothetical protein
MRGVMWLVAKVRQPHPLLATPAQTQRGPLALRQALRQAQDRTQDKLRSLRPCSGQAGQTPKSCRPISGPRPDRFWLLCLSGLAFYPTNLHCQGRDSASDMQQPTSPVGEIVSHGALHLIDDHALFRQGGRNVNGNSLSDRLRDDGQCAGR